ncbi:rod-binding protein [Histidinibacterium lentulum]|uniref:Flagellar biosynthesis protein FlgJ n=1 Tax=Histidinibacterium lentulum TaxID=2480588 RepID=A0A3N2R776_9RHOB|nr:rod-binding protein [Histidinibacterium lentulum]ROU03258.1 flagellar biosynthesis protein FlgJ [Histidinibacterium lentulum]
MTDITPTGPVPAISPHDARLRHAAKELEGAFLAEMLSAAGLGKTREGLGGGGAGEDQFSSFLTRRQAMVMAEAGGIGLAESIFRSLKERADD